MSSALLVLGLDSLYSKPDRNTITTATSKADGKISDPVWGGFLDAAAGFCGAGWDDDTDSTDTLSGDRTHDPGSIVRIPYYTRCKQ